MEAKTPRMKSDELPGLHRPPDQNIIYEQIYISTSALPAFTIIHVAISLTAIASGFIVLIGMIADRPLDGWTAFFLATTALTSVTGFGFPIKGMTPGIALGMISLVVLATAIYPRYPRHLAGIWRRVYVIGAVFALYLNFFVLVVQSFQKVTALHSLAPKQTEPPFLAAQVVSMVAFIALGTLAVKRFRADPFGVAWPRFLLPGDQS